METIKRTGKRGTLTRSNGGKAWIGTFEATADGSPSCGVRVTTIGSGPDTVAVNLRGYLHDLRDEIDAALAALD